jgi:antitoxin (DNA-binding transcriptional repressor) of toxin-antitoxin stability system
VASGGDDFIITRRGKPVARLLPVADTESSVEHALELLLAAREASVHAPGSLRELIDDGRTQ